MVCIASAIVNRLQLAAAALLAASPVSAQPQAAPSAAPAARAVSAVEPWIDLGDRPAWAPRGDWIAYDKPDDLGLSRLWVAKPDGSRSRCLTCTPREFRKLHTGNASWHPSGELLVFQVEEPAKLAGVALPFRAVPGGNRGDEDLWAISFDGRRFWNLTHRGEQGSRFAAPRFSREGDQLVWSERLASGGGAWGRWALQVARFQRRRGVPRLVGARGHEPGPQRLYAESCDFAADDRGILFAANLETGQLERGMDLYELRLDDGTLRRITRTPDELDRFARFSPNGRWIAWVTDRDIPPGRDRFRRRGSPTFFPSDLWLMAADGSRAERLTHFSDVFSSDYLGKMMAGPPAWSPEGDRLLVPIASVEEPKRSRLYMVVLAGPIGR